MMQSVPEKMRLEMVIGMQIAFLNVATSQFSNGLFKKKNEFESTTISDSSFHSNNHFEFRLLGTRLHGDGKDTTVLGHLQSRRRETTVQGRCQSAQCHIRDNGK